MKVLVINCGSSSLKYQLYNMQNEEVLAKGLVERIGINDSRLKQNTRKNEKFIINKDIKNHNDAIKLVMEALTDKQNGAIDSINEINAVGHRVVHGGEKYSSPVLINNEVINHIKECFKLAPLHNPANLIGIETFMKIMPGVKNVAVFDTAFHQTIPEKAYLYGIPYKYYEKDHIRKYGFHGTSHYYVSRKVAEIMNKDIKDLKIITCHLGNGASLCAIDGGKSIDTTMGFTPLDGVIMGTRSGSLDPAIILYLMKEYKYSLEEMDDILNKKSGVYGLSKLSPDFRDIENAANSKNHMAQKALDTFHYKIKLFIGAYMAALGKVDAIVFTAGVGENGPETRYEILKGLEGLGIEIDKEKNKVRGKALEISKDTSKVKVYVIPTDEEFIIAKSCVML
ncbi:MAG: acetate kinase [Clostridiales bacterium]|nr:acetate kinase [Clostridiales bacterium]NLK24144.1 acetate kinase [Clostridiales bacterium]